MTVAVPLAFAASTWLFLQAAPHSDDSSTGSKQVLVQLFLLEAS